MSHVTASMWHVPKGIPYQLDYVFTICLNSLDLGYILLYSPYKLHLRKIWIIGIFKVMFIDPATPKEIFCNLCHYSFIPELKSESQTTLL